MAEIRQEDRISRASRNFWRDFLDNAQPSQFPSALPQRSDRNDSGQRTLDSVESLRFEHEKAISKSLLLAAWALVVSIHTLNNDVVFGLSSEDTSDRFLPFRVLIPENDGNCSDLVASVQSSLGTVTEHGTKDVLLDHITQLSASCKAASSFTSALEFRSVERAHDTSRNIRLEIQSCSILVSCVITATSTQLTLYADQLHHSQMVSQTLLRHFSLAIKSLSSSQATLLDRIEWLKDIDLDEIDSWAQEAEPLAKEPYLHRVIEEQARLHPLSIAIGQTDSVMTYAELDEGATALAAHLTKTESVSGNVAVLFSKSAFAVLSMLAILKAGCGK